MESKKEKIKAKVNKRIRVRESTLVSQQLYEYQINKEMQIINGEAAIILLNNKVDSIVENLRRRQYAQGGIAFWYMALVRI